MEFFFSTVAGFMGWLSIHDYIAYGVLFFGMYFETLIFTSVVLPGEIFLLAGPILAGTGVLNIWLVCIVLYGGAVLGDNSSFLLGRRLGKSFFKEGRFIFNPQNYAKGEKYFREHGKKSIFLARLLGPLSWITPFLAGTYGISYRDFLKYNLPGILVGVGEFLVVGYFFGSQYRKVLFIVQHYVLAVIAGIMIILIAVWYFKKRKAGRKVTQDITL